LFHHVGHGNTCTLLGKAEGIGAAEAAATARYNGDFISQNHGDYLFR
jgi:hypothetical protein